MKHAAGKKNLNGRVEYEIQGEIERAKKENNETIDDKKARANLIDKYLGKEEKSQN